MARIGLIGKNSVNYIKVLLNIWNQGHCAVLIDWRIPVKTAISMMREANVETCYIESDQIKKYVTDLYSISLIPFEQSNSTAEFLPTELYKSFTAYYSDKDALIIYSSGTTGRSKGVVLSHRAINNNADAIIDYMNLTKTDCLYIVKNISHASTIVGEVLVALKSKIPLVIAPTVVPPRYILDNINRYNVSIICVNPTILKLLSNEYRINQQKYNIWC